MPTAYALGQIKRVFVIGNGWVRLGDTIDERVVSDMVDRNGRLYLMADLPTPHVVGSFPSASIGPIWRDIPDAPTDETVTGETGNDTVTG